MLNAFDGCMRSMRLSTTRRIAAFDLRKRSLGLSMRMRALLSFGEADRDRRASCRFYTKSARPPEAFRAD
jgi:hypothetical protein